MVSAGNRHIVPAVSRRGQAGGALGGGDVWAACGDDVNEKCSAALSKLRGATQALQCLVGKYDEVAEDCPTYAPWYADRAAFAATIVPATLRMPKPKSYYETSGSTNNELYTAARDAAKAYDAAKHAAKPPS